MADDLKIRRPQDPTKVNVHEAWEVRYWCTKWNVTEAQLRAAVNKAGTTSTTAVARTLGKQA